MRGPCAKQRVTCTITYGPELSDFVIGENDCANPQEECPRLPGEDYAKCQSICHQGGHAEVDAVRKAAEAGIDLRGAVAVLQGHYYACEPCAKALQMAGVSRINVLVRKP